ncbi:hypothetical protein K6U44_03100 [Vibrio parahaemolyticus]|nr:hypothetical protein [Vibrio parahaemolyticus]
MDNRKLAISLLNDLGFEHKIIVGPIIPPLGDIYHYWASAKTQKVIPSKEIIEPKTFKECYGRTKKEPEPDCSPHPSSPAQNLKKAEYNPPKFSIFYL